MGVTILNRSQSAWIEIFRDKLILYYTVQKFNGFGFFFLLLNSYKYKKCEFIRWFIRMTLNLWVKKGKLNWIALGTKLAFYILFLICIQINWVSWVVHTKRMFFFIFHFFFLIFFEFGAGQKVEILKLRQTYTHS